MNGNQKTRTKIKREETKRNDTKIIENHKRNHKNAGKLKLRIIIF